VNLNSLKKKKMKLGMVLHACDPNTLILSHRWQRQEVLKFEASQKKLTKSQHSGG
jgi:hypothetical protein